MRRLSFLAFLAFIATANAGALNPEVKQANLKETVCRAGYTRTIRPTPNYTQAWEKLNGGGRTTVVDHIVPLCVGGHPMDFDNLQLQTRAESVIKDRAERLACRLLCQGRLTLKEARTFFWQ